MGRSFVSEVQYRVMYRTCFTEDHYMVKKHGMGAEWTPWLEYRSNRTKNTQPNVYAKLSDSKRAKTYMEREYSIIDNVEVEFKIEMRIIQVSDWVEV